MIRLYSMMKHNDSQIIPYFLKTQYETAQTCVYHSERCILLCRHEIYFGNRKWKLAVSWSYVAWIDTKTFPLLTWSNFHHSDAFNWRFIYFFSQDMRTAHHIVENGRLCRPRSGRKGEISRGRAPEGRKCQFSPLWLWGDPPSSSSPDILILTQPISPSSSPPIVRYVKPPTSPSPNFLWWLNRAKKLSVLFKP